MNSAHIRTIHLRNAESLPLWFVLLCGRVDCGVDGCREVVAKGMCDAEMRTEVILSW